MCHLYSVHSYIHLLLCSVTIGEVIIKIQGIRLLDMCFAHEQYC